MISKPITYTAFAAAFLAAAQLVGAALNHNRIADEAASQAQETNDFQLGAYPLPDIVIVEGSESSNFFDYGIDVNITLKFSNNTAQKCVYNGRTRHLFGIPLNTEKSLVCQAPKPE